MATWAMRKRYEWIEARLAAGEPFTRQDLVEAFTITSQTATATLHQFRDLHPGALAYDAGAKRFLRPNQATASGLSQLERKLAAALRDLTFQARTSGGVAGPDAGLLAACANAETILAPLTPDGQAKDGTT